MNLILEQKDAAKDSKFFILSPNNENAKNASTVEKFIRYLNEKSTNDLIAMDIIDSAWAIVEVTKMI